MKKEISFAIDIGSRTTRIIAVEKNQSSLPKVRAISKVDTKGVRHGRIIDRRKAKESIMTAVSQIEESLGFKIKKIAISSGGIGLRSDINDVEIAVGRPDGEITEADTRRALKDAESLALSKNKWILETKIIASKVDGQEIEGSPVGYHGENLTIRAISISSPYKQVEDIASIIEEIGIKVSSIIPGGVALSELVLSESQKQAGSLVLDIGAETTTATVFENGIPVAVFVFSFGGDDITNEIALKLRVSIDEAEALKTGVPTTISIAKKKYDEIVNGRIEELFQTVDNFLKKIKRSELLPGGVHICGGGSFLDGIENVCKNKLRLPAQVGTPQAKEGEKNPVKDPLWFLVYGVAIEDMKEDHDDVSFDDGENPIKNIFKNIFSQLKP
ncbi:pilus assembly protein PilM [Candidatus Nomurabacteria bacterium]|nr:pilus assembly protein PilM [Candidatus Nomurabacteria bacterium]USN95011.1 MAG: pilus assembly protein PilM [Candidatus Nomurabacteria bacterium]